MASLTSAARKKQAPVVDGAQRDFANNANAGESGWMPPQAQRPMPQAKFGGPHRKMHAPGLRKRGR